MRPSLATGSCAFVLCCSALCAAQETKPAPPTLGETLHTVRAELHLDSQTGALSGPGADVLRHAIDGAQFVFVGEDHITREIPQFTAALCNAMAPKGLTAFVTEASVEAGAFVQARLHSPDRVKDMHDLVTKYPASVAFLDVREENDLAAHCASVAKDAHFQVWGLDQEFVGSDVWLIDQILATKPGPNATAVLQKLRSDSEARNGEAAASPEKMGRLLMLSPDTEAFANIRQLLEKEGSTRARALFQELTQSAEIYSLQQSNGARSNAMRAVLLKQNLQRDIDSAGPLDHQRMLLKFGDWHAYRGYNPLHQRDLGNYVAEFADVNGAPSVHILVLGAKGTHRAFSGYGKPTHTEPFVMSDDSDYHWFKHFADAQVGNVAWTVFDLRAMRFGKTRAADMDLQRLVDGFDLLVVIPEITSATMIEEQ